MPTKLITAKDIASKFNLPYHTINYYTAIGLLRVVSKKGTQRLYNEEAISQRLKDISAMIAEGYNLRLIRRKLVEEGT